MESHSVSFRAGESSAWKCSASWGPHWFNFMMRNNVKNESIKFHDAADYWWWGIDASANNTKSQRLMLILLIIWLSSDDSPISFH